MSAQAAAGTLLLDLRTDYDSAIYNEAANQPNEIGFTIHTARADFRGNFNDALSYRFRLRFNSEATDTGTDSLSSRVDFAQITHKLDAFSITAGKFVTDVGGFETIGDAREVFLRSEANRALTGTYASVLDPAANVSYQTKYATGVRVGWKTGAGELSLLAANNPEGDAADNPEPQTRLLSGVIYKGSYLDGLWQTVLSYHEYAGNRDSAASMEDTKTSTMAAGVRWDNKAQFAQLDYVQLDDKDLMLATELSDVKITSWIGEVGTRWDSWTFKAKAELSEMSESPDAAAGTRLKVQGLGAVVQYQVFDEPNLRYHLAWTQKTRQREGQPDPVTQHVLAGLIFYHDLLK